MSVPSTPLLGCAPTGAVVLSVSNMSRVAGVNPSTLVNALRQQTDDKERVDITETVDDIVIGEEGAPPLRGCTLARKGRILNGTRHDDINESSALLSRSVSSTKSLPVYSQTPMQTPLSVRIKALHDPIDSLYLIPRLDEVSTCIVVPDSEGEQSKWLPRLPSNVKEVKDIGISEGAYYLVIEYARPAVIWMILIAAVAALASKAIVARVMYPDNVSPLLKSVWMTSFSLAAFVLFALAELIPDPGTVSSQVRDLLLPKPAANLRSYLLGGDLVDFEDPHHFHLSSFTLDKSRRRSYISSFSLKMLILSGVLHGLFSVSFLISLDYTTLAKCVVLVNLHPVLILMSTYGSSRMLERVGAMGVVAGILLLYRSSKDEEVIGQSESIIGDLMAFMVSVYMWIYLSVTQKLQQELPSMCLMVCINAISLTVQILFTVMAGSALDVTLDAFNEFYVGNLLGGVIGGTVAYGGFVLCSRYLSPLVISVNITMEPLYAVCLNVFAGGSFPTPATWGALAIICIGATVVAIGGKHRSDNKQITIPNEIFT